MSSVELGRTITVNVTDSGSKDLDGKEGSENVKLVGSSGGGGSGRPATPPGGLSGSASVAQEKYYSYLRSLRGAWKDLPEVSVSYSQLSYRMDIPVNDTDVPSILKSVLGIGRRFTLQKKPTYELQGLKDVSGVVRPGEMTLILAPPGHGKSLLLKSLSSRVRTGKYLSGSVLYNGLSAADLESQTGLRANKLCAYVAQQDLHMSLLTVRETFRAALAHSVADVSLLQDEALQKQHEDKVDLLIDVLGLRECADTIVGNDLVRGCSGGQKKRVTIGEQLIGNARTLFLDEITTGLDAAVAFDILNVLKNWCQIMGGSVVAALLQPTPEIYALFSQVLLLREGQCVYTGPREQVGHYLFNLGIKCPNDQDEADFIVDFLTDPALYAAKFRQRELRFLRRQLSDKARGGSQKHFFAESKLSLNRQQSASISDRPIVTFHVGSTAERVELTQEDEKVMKDAEDLAKKTVEQIEKHEPVRAAENIPLSTTALVEVFHKSEQWKNLNSELDELHGKARVKAGVEKIVAKKSEYTKTQFQDEYSHSIFYHLGVNVRRQAIYVGRNKLMIFPRIFSALFMGMCIGTLYINLPTSNYISRLGLILFACIFLAFSNLSELPVSEELKKAVGKHMDASWYPAWVQIFATIILTLPIAVFEVIFFSLLVYFVPHFDYDGGRYFFALLMLYMSNLVLGSIFRAVSYLVPTQVIAQQLGGPIIVMFMAFGGFLITESNIPDYLIEFFWLSPFAWGLRSLALNEFNDGRYSNMVPNPSGEAGNVRQGDGYLSIYQIRTANEWKWAGFGYLVGLFLFFGMLTSLALKYMRYDDSVGTKRPPEEEAIRSKMSLEAVEVAIQQELELHSQAHPGSQLRRLPSEKRVASNSSVLPFVPTTMTWRDVVYSIPVDGADRVLLNGVSGYARPGVLTALMGASGAGKTTLIDVLAGRKTQGALNGDILVNGVPFRQVNFRRVLGYVEQNDLHFPLDTVREALLFSANLRLPAEVTQKQREAFVDELIELLELKPIANRIVGSDYVAGLAGWQRKLVTIGVELASNPAILCLDEPTSGLDSRAALVVMRVIRKIASTGRSVICTIHQPSQEVFLMFDRLLLLKSGGETVYFGPLGAGDADTLVEYFETATPEAPIAPIPPKMNPASWMLEVIGAGTVKNNQADYAQVFKRHSLAQQLEVDFKDIDRDLEATKSANVKKSAEGTSPTSVNEYASSIIRQFYYVQKRAFSSYWRNVPLNLTRFLLVIGIGLLFGLLYRNTRDVGHTLANLQSKISSIYMTIGFSSALQTIIVVPVLMFDRPAYYREKFSMTYASSVYSMATFIVDLPYVFTAAVLFNCTFYFMTHLPYDGAIFFRYILAAFLNQMTFISAGHLMAASTPNFVVATQLLGIFFTFFFLFGGTFIPPASIPKGWIWMYYIDSLPKAVMACLGEIYNCDGLSTDDGGSCEYINAPGDNGSIQRITYNQWVETSYDTATGQYGKWIGYLILTIAVYRILVALSLAKISHIKR